MAVSGAPSGAPYAADPLASRGRLHAEPPSATRSDFRRDCDRIIHSSAFRRLAYKTQVFVYREGDHYRNRLTHTLEVTQIARSLARALGLDEDLAEACALAHDLGHPPFGHSGERALDSCLAAEGGFDHNAQTLAVVTRLERRYAGFDGLNLTWETLEGLAKHNGPLIDAAGHPTGSAAKRGVAREIVEYSARQDLRLAEYPSAEAQAGAIADDIAYDAHDIDDGLRAAMFGIDDLRALPLLRDILTEIDARHPGLSGRRQIHELVRRLITRMIEDVIACSQRRLAALGPAGCDDIRRAARAGGGVFSGDGGGRPCHQGFFVPAHVPPSPGDADHGRCRGGGAGAVRPLPARSRRAAVAPRRAGARAGPLAGDRRFRRRDDRSLRALRARAAF